MPQKQAIVGSNLAGSWAYFDLILADFPYHTRAALVRSPRVG